jgi:transposase
VDSRPIQGEKGSTMPKGKPPYPREFRERVVELARSGRTFASLVREFNVSEPTIRSWIKQSDLNAGRRSDGVTSDERAELARLRRENRTLREEREILKKAAADSTGRRNTSMMRCCDA